MKERAQAAEEAERQQKLRRQSDKENQDEAADPGLNGEIGGDGAKNILGDEGDEDVIF